MMKYLLFLSIFPVFYLQAQCDNLVMNPYADEGLTGRIFINDIGEVSSEGWSIEVDQSDNKTFKCSHNWITKNQEIDLSSHYTVNYLNTEPEIYVQEMYKGYATTDDEIHYNDLYYLHVELRDASRNIIASYTEDTEENRLIATQNWQTSNHTFSSYGAGSDIFILNQEVKTTNIGLVVKGVVTEL